MLSKPVTKAVTAIITENRKIVSEENENEVINVVVFETDHVASVSAKYGVTLNMGNYEACRFDVMVTLPCYIEEIDKSIVVAAEKAEKYVRDQARGYLNKRAQESKE